MNRIIPVSIITFLLLIDALLSLHIIFHTFVPYTSPKNDVISNTMPTPDPAYLPDRLIVQRSTAPANARSLFNKTITDPQLVRTLYSSLYALPQMPPTPHLELGCSPFGPKYTEFYNLWFYHRTTLFLHATIHKNFCGWVIDGNHFLPRDPDIGFLNLFAKSIGLAFDTDSDAMRL